MSLVASAQRFVLLCVLLAMLGEYALSIEVVGDNPTWNYNQHGQDWDFANCNVETEVQSPYELVSTAGQYFGWDTMCDVSFLAAWKSANITSDKYGASNYVLRINATDGNLGAFYAVEPFAGSAQIYWEVLGIRFHYPSEHTIDGVSFDMEMQVTLNDTK